MVRDNTFQEAMEFPDVIEEESGCSFYYDCCVHQNKVHPFGDRIHNSHDSIISGGLWEFDHEINAEHIPPCIWHRERLQLTNQRMSPRFHPKAEITGTYILADVPRHLRPLVIPGHQF